MIFLTENSLTRLLVMLKDTSWALIKPSLLSSQASNFPANDVSCGRVQFLLEKVLLSYCLDWTWLSPNEWIIDWLTCNSASPSGSTSSGFVRSWVETRVCCLILILNWKSIVILVRKSRVPCFPLFQWWLNGKGQWTRPLASHVFQLNAVTNQFNGISTKETTRYKKS